MNWKQGLSGLVLMTSMAMGHSAVANVAVGDKPVLEFRDAGSGTSLSLAKFHGKIIVVDFWATWCGPCMAEADHMVKLNTEFAPKGMQFIGVTLDTDKQKMLGVAKEKNFSWPQYFDGQAWKSAPAQSWGVDSIPRTFIIGPDGSVLWTGHPGNIDGPLADAFKNHPPQLVDPKLLSDASAIADKVDAALIEGSGAPAIKLMATIPPGVKADGVMAARLSALEARVGVFADKMLADVEPLVTEKKYVEASSKLSDLSKALSGTPTGAKANKRLVELMQMPEFKAQVELARKTKACEDDLAVAQKLAADGKDDQAYLHYKAIVASYPGVPGTDTAKQAVATFEKNPDLVKRANETAVSGKAAASLKLADNYLKAGRKDLAVKKYNEVIQQFPNTSFAKTAADALKANE